MSTVKRCRGCGQHKPGTAYHVRRHRRDGRDCLCYECRAVGWLRAWGATVARAGRAFVGWVRAQGAR